MHPGWRSLVRGMWWLLVMLTLLAAAWLASNVIDAEPVPRLFHPNLEARRIAPDQNDFYALVALDLRSTEPDAKRAGQDEWARLQQRGAGQSDAARLTRPSGGPFECPGQGHCGSHWRVHARELQAQLAEHAELGRRCVSLASTFDFEEALPSTLAVTTPMASHGLGASLCSRWLEANAVLAMSRGNSDATWLYLQTADSVARKLLAGSRTLIGQAIAWRVARRTWQTVYLLAGDDPAGAARAIALLRPLSAAEAPRGAWMAAEAAFQHASFDEILAACSRDLTSADDEPEWSPVNELSGLGRWACRHRVGMLPNQSHADIDRVWTARVPMAQSEARLREVLASGLPSDRGPHWLAMYWRNTVARVVFDVGDVSYQEYFAREADVELHREALVLALEARTHQIPRDQRAAWILDRAQRSDRLRGRVEWDGLFIRVKTWQEMIRPRHERDEIRLEP